MLVLILGLPLISAIICGFFGGLIGQRGSCFFSCCLIFLCIIGSFFCFYFCVLDGQTFVIVLQSWFKVSLVEVNWGLLFDSVTSIMLVVVSSVSFLVHVYSAEYMKHDPHQSRFISYLSLFTFFIFVLVTANNLVQIFVGWEGVGLCSFLLINFWFTRIQANKAAIKAMLVNRVGDFGLCLGLFCIFFGTGSFDYAVIFSLVPFFIDIKINFFFFSVSLVDACCFFIFVGCVGKSAQIGLHTWLPDAIEGPTPVSALIHAATIVTAGVFLLVRCSPLFEFSPSVLFIVTCFGGATSFFAATTGLVQTDIKKVIAYSTCSQLGYIVFACGISCYDTGIFHLLNHAFFKALLFLCAGSVIHALNDEQDVRRIGGLVNLLPFTYSIILVGSLALAGFPFLSGFYSKDLILETSVAVETNSGIFVYFLGTFVAFLTAFYSIRLLFLSFFRTPKGFKKSYENIHEAPFLISVPLFFLCFGSLFSGFFLRDLVIGPGSDFFSSSVFVLPSHYSLFAAEFNSLFAKLMPVFCSFLGIVCAVFFYGARISLLFWIKKSCFMLFTFLNKKWFFDKVYNEFIVQKFFCISYQNTYVLLDKGVFELVGPFGFSHLFFRTIVSVRSLHSGLLFHQSFLILFGILAVFGFFFFESLFSNFDLRLIFILCFIFILGHIAQW